MSKVLTQFAAENNLDLVNINYSNGCKGYDFVKKDSKQIVVSIEPINRTNEKWFFRTTHENYIGKHYFKSISKKMFVDINVKENSFYILSTPTQ